MSVFGQEYPDPFVPPPDEDEPRNPLPELVPLVDLLAEPEEPVRFRIAGLLPTGARALLAAQFKAGKTTMRDNLVRSLADGTPFLDEFAIEPLEDGRTVVVIDNEMSRGQLRRWLADQGIGRPEIVRVVVLRGQVGKFNLIDPYTRAAWADHLRSANAGLVIFDCLRPVLDALGLSEDKDSGKFLTAFDALLHQAGVDEAVVVHHMGHSGERSRGDSRLRDWPDVEWRLVREQPPAGEEPDPAAPRYFSAYGRDVDVLEGAVTFDPNTRHLSRSEGTRRDAGGRRALEDVLDVLQIATEPLSGRAVEMSMQNSGHARNDIRRALKIGIRDGLIETQPGRKNSTLHSVRRSAPQFAGRTEFQCASAPLGARGALTADNETHEECAGGALAARRCLTCSAELDAAAKLIDATTCTTCEMQEVSR